LSSATPEGRLIAQAVAVAFGGRPAVFKYWDDARTSSVDVAERRDCPQPGVTSYSTLSLSEWPLFDNGREYQDTRIELVGACESTVSGFGEAISTAAFCVINSKWFCFPGAVFPDVLAIHEISPTLQHMFFVEPFLWTGLSTLRLPGRIVSWLMAVPISEAEYAYAIDRGHEALNRLLVEKQIDVFDLARQSTV
jgi:antitoxin YqcF